MTPTLIVSCLPSNAFRRSEPAEAVSKAVALATRAEAAIVARLGEDQPPQLDPHETGLINVNDHLRRERFDFCVAVMAEGVRRLKSEGVEISDELLARIAEVGVAGLEAAGLAFRLPEVKPAPEPPRPEPRERTEEERAELDAYIKSIKPEPRHEAFDVSARILGVELERAAAVAAAVRTATDK